MILISELLYENAIISLADMCFIFLPVRTHPSFRNVSLLCAGRLRYPMATCGPFSQTSPGRFGPRDSPVSTSTICRNIDIDLLRGQNVA